MNSFKYVLITAARNEASYIERTIKSVIGQTVLPQKWVIISDGSTDETDNIITRYTEKYSFIQMIRTAGREQRDWGGKVNAINLGYKEMEGIEFDFIGNLDADVSFEPNYYEFLLSKFNEDSKLGLAGGRIADFINGKWIDWIARFDSVGGPVQMFRREFYEQMGGYRMLRYGGEDAVAEFIARKMGWEIRSFSEIKVHHHRRMGTEGRSIWQAKFLHGKRDYLIGYHPLFEIGKCIRRVHERPYFLGSLIWLSGYFESWLRREKYVLPNDIIVYIRQEQIHYLLNTFSILNKKESATEEKPSVINHNYDFKPVEITSKVKYVIITCVRNEERYIEKTIQSVINQTIKPIEWIIVNDGSTDKTKDIVEKYIEKNSWIKLINKSDCGVYKLGAGVVESFYLGLSEVHNEYDFLVKLDGDLSFENDYFEFIFAKFNANLHLGMASGQSFVPENNKLVWEDTPQDHVKGLLCTYKKKCFDDIGGLIKSLGWDTVDEVMARMKGWETRSFVEKKIIHYRKLGSKMGILNGNSRHGYIAYIIGSHPLYVIFRCTYRLFTKPYVIGSFYYFWGYFVPWLTNEKKVVNKDIEQFYRKEQLSKLFSQRFYKFYFYKLTKES